MSEDKKHEIKINKGIAFYKSNKQGNQPDINGKLNVNGEIYLISLWKNISKGGNEYYSISLKNEKEFLKESYKEKKINEESDYVDNYFNNIEENKNNKEDIYINGKPIETHNNSNNMDLSIFNSHEEDENSTSNNSNTLEEELKSLFGD